MMLPHSHNRNILLFYLLTVFNNAWFVMGNWIFFWLMFMNYGQLGWVDALCFAFGMLMEIPTGAISDLVGKKNTLKAALALSAIGFYVVGFGSSLTHVFIGFLITQAGWAFYSGAAEALAYDSLKEQGKEKEFDDVISTSHSIYIVSTVVCTLAGIFLYQLHFRLPHLGVAIAYSIGFVLTFFLREPRVDTEKFSWKSYTHQLSQGFHQLLQPALKRFTFFIITLLGVYYLFSYGFLKPAILEHFGFYATGQGIIMACLSLFSAYLVRFIPAMRKRFSEAQGLIFLNILLALGFISVGVFTGFWGVATLVLIVSSGSLANPWVSVVVNREIPSQYRATTLSTISMITKIPYILAAAVAGGLIQQGFLVQLCVSVGVLTLVAMALNIFIYRASLFKKTYIK